MYLVLLPLPVGHGGSSAAPPRPRRLNGLKVVIDPGHGGKDPGAIFAGVSEKQVTLPISRKVIAKLEKLGVQAITTRSGDTYPSLDARASLANRRRADLFISIHANSAPRRSARGVEILYRADGAGAAGGGGHMPLRRRLCGRALC